MLPLLATGAASLGLLALWLQAKCYSPKLSQGISILAIAAAIVFFVGSMAYPESFRYSYRIDWFFVTQTWIIAQAILRIRTAFSTDSSVSPFAAAIGVSMLPNFIINEILPQFFPGSLKNPNTYIEISLLLSTVTISATYQAVARFFPLAESRRAMFKHYLLKALIRAAIIQLIGLLFLLLYAYLLKQNQYWSAKLLAVPITFSVFATYGIGKWITGKLPEWTQATEPELIDIVQPVTNIAMPATSSNPQNQKLGRP